MGVRENRVETYLKKQIKLLGGQSFKWVSPGLHGVPDQIVILKGVVWFVEVKTLDGKLSIQQARRRKDLQNLDANVTVVHGNQSVDKFINKLKQEVLNASAKFQKK